MSVEKKSLISSRSAAKKAVIARNVTTKASASKGAPLPQKGAPFLPKKSPMVTMGAPMVTKH